MLFTGRSPGMSCPLYRKCSGQYCRVLMVQVACFHGNKPVCLWLCGFFFAACFVCFAFCTADISRIRSLNLFLHTVLDNMGCSAVQQVAGNCMGVMGRWPSCTTRSPLPCNDTMRGITWDLDFL